MSIRPLAPFLFIDTRARDHVLLTIGRIGAQRKSTVSLLCQSFLGFPLFLLAVTKVIGRSSAFLLD
jgi:hypothetical protein